MPLFTAVIYCIFYFISIDETPAMGSQPNLASRSEVVSIYKCPQKFRRPSPQNSGWQKHQIFYHFFRDFCTQHRISPEQNFSLTNQNASVYLQCVPEKLTYFPRPLTQKRLRSVCWWWPTLWKFSIFCHCWASHTKATEARPTKFCQMFEGLRGLLSTVRSHGPQGFYRFGGHYVATIIVVTCLVGLYCYCCCYYNCFVLSINAVFWDQYISLTCP